MVLLEAEPALAISTDVFQEGNVHYKWFKVDGISCCSSSSSPPKPLLIFTPIVPGVYPVIVFCHGFYVRNDFYSQLFAHIASHGFIIVAPQFYEWITIPGCTEVNCAAKVTDWIDDGLQPLLNQNVQANLDKVVLAGHSRGGKTAFAVALGYAQTKLNFKVLVGIDPVAGLSKCKICRTSPHILTNVPQSFNLKIPVVVIGTGLGPEKANCCSIPCAPDGVNHEEFFKECKPPCAHFVAKDYGHMDMLDDNPPGLVGEVLSKCMCKNGTGPKDLMRKTVGGLVVAYLRAHLDGQRQDLDAILANPGLAPAKLEPFKHVAV